jgi:inner membrane transporter RhtA
VPPAGVLALASMVFVQVGTAASVGLFDRVGVAGTAWLRMLGAAVVFLLLARPRLSSLTPSVLRSGLLLGVVTGLVTLFFLSAIDRIPLGTAAAVEFLGPLAVAVGRSGRRRDLLWPALAAAGILALTEPWHGATDPVGIGFALAAACCWGAYILLTQHVGDALHGVQGLAISMPAAAVVTGLIGAPHAIGQLDVGVLLAGLGLALLSPAIPFALEMLALRRLTAAAFGTLMSLEPAVALAIGAVMLGQRPAVWQLGGVLLVVAAGIGAERHGRRAPAGAVGSE